MCAIQRNKTDTQANLRQLIQDIKKLPFPIRWVFIAEFVFNSWKFFNEDVWFVGIAFVICHIAYYNYKQAPSGTLTKIHWEGTLFLTCANLLDEILRVNDDPINVNDYFLLACILSWWFASYMGWTVKIRRFIGKVKQIVRGYAASVIYKIKNTTFISFLITNISRINDRFKR